MALTTPTISNAAAWVNTDALSSTNLNNQFNPLKNFTNAIDGFSRIVTSSATYNITANTEVILYVDASAGTRNVNLPSATGQLQSITIKKIDTTFNNVIINRTGSDTIETHNSYALSPITTSLTINIPDQSVILSPNGTQWRVEASHIKNLVQFRAFLSSPITMIANSSLSTLITMNNDSTPFLSYDYANVYDTTNSRFVAPINGLYEFSGQFREASMSGSSHFVRVSYFKNGSFLTFAIQLAINAASITGDYIAPFSTLAVPLNAGDFMDVRYTLGTGSTGTLQAGSESTYWQGRLVRAL